MTEARGLNGEAEGSYLLRVPEAARLTGLPPSLLRKCFMAEHKRPRNVPAPPPHVRVGRAVYVIASKLAAWAESLSANQGQRKRGRPTVAQRIARRQQQTGRA